MSKVNPFYAVPLRGKSESGRRCPWGGCGQARYCCCPATRATTTGNKACYWTVIVN